MAEELAAGCVDAIGAAAEIDLVEVKLEDLLLGKLGFERHRQDRLARLAVERAVVVEKDVPGELLRDGGGRRYPPVSGGGDIDRTHQSDRIDPEMRIEAPVLRRDQRLLHHRRDLIRAEPLSIAGAELDDLAAVARTHHDGLTDLGRLQLVEAGQRPRREGHREAEEQNAEQGKSAAPQQQALQPAALGFALARCLFGPFLPLRAFTAAAPFIHCVPGSSLLPRAS